MSKIAVKERPIVYSALNIPPLLAGRKTQTRRIVKTFRWHYDDGTKSPLREIYHNAPILDWEMKAMLPSCPYGVPGERLWVREAWRTGSKLDALNATEIEAKANDAGYMKGPYGPIWYEADGKYRAWGDLDRHDFGDLGRLRVPRFMPRWASRITHVLTNVRVERLQAISEADAMAEGIETTCPCAGGCNQHRTDYRKLWESINGPGSWKANPHVWVLEFELVKESAP